MWMGCPGLHGPVEVGVCSWVCGCGGMVSWQSRRVGRAEIDGPGARWGACVGDLLPVASKSSGPTLLIIAGGAAVYRIPGQK
jgi:hypothetical protein